MESIYTYCGKIPAEGEVAFTVREKDYLCNSVSVAVYEEETTALTFYLFKDEKV